MFQHHRRHAASALYDNIQALRDEVGHLSRQVQKQGHGAYAASSGTANDAYDLLRSYADQVVPLVLRGGRRAGRTARKNPATTVLAAVAAGAVVVGIYSLFVRR